MSNDVFVLLVVAALLGAAGATLVSDRTTRISRWVAAFFGTAIVTFIVLYLLLVRKP